MFRSLQHRILHAGIFDGKATPVCCAPTDLRFGGLGALLSQGLDVVPKRIPAPRWPGVHCHQDPFAAQDSSLARLDAYPRDLPEAKAFDSSDDQMILQHVY